MTTFQFLALASALVNGYLAFLVYLKNRKNITNIALGLFILSIAGWSFSIATLSATADMFWSDMVFFFGFLLGSSFTIVSKTFPVYNQKVNLRLFLILIPILVVFFTLPFRPFIKGIVIHEDSLEPVLGPAYPIMVILAVGYIAYALFKLIKKYRQSSGLAKLQLKYLLFGLFLFLISMLLTNVILPLFKVYHLTSFGPVFSIILTAFITYSIVKHRLMDIRIVIRKSVVYFGALVTVMLIGLGLMMLNIRTFQNVIPAMISGPLVLLIGVILFNPIKNLYLKTANKYFFTSLYNYQATLEKLAQELTHTIDLDQIIDSIVGTIRNTMKLDRAGVLLFDEQTSNYQIKKTIGFTEANGISLVRSNFLTNYLSKNRHSILYQELESLQNNGEGEKSEIGKLKSNMKRIEASLCLPLLIKDRLIGIIVLGEKISKEAYTTEDLNLLESLTNQASIAIENARLYKQIQNFSETLQQKVDEQTKDIKEKNIRLQELLKMKSEFLSIASHQLRTPLTAIRGLLAMQADGDLDKLPEKKRKEEQRHMLTAADHLNIIVNDLLDAMELEGGNLNFKFQPVDLGKIIKEAVEELKPMFDKKKLYIKFIKPSKQIPKVEAEPKYIREVIMNVIDNTEKYTNKGGVTILLSKKNSHVLIEVKDTGIGIPREDFHRLFKKFSRGEGAQFQHANGSGLGLFIVQNIMNEHNGDIKIISKGEGKGTTVILTLPIKQPAKKEKSNK